MQKETKMNCPKCNHPQEEHTTNGCYHVTGVAASYVCDCDLTPLHITSAALEATNAELLDALKQLESVTMPDLEQYPDYESWEACMKACAVARAAIQKAES